MSSIDKSDSSGYRCAVCGNPEVDMNLSSIKSPYKMVCDWSCAMILNWKLIVICLIISVFGILGSLIVTYWYLLLFIPFSVFSFYSLSLILLKRGEKIQDRLEYIGDES